ncbi:putative protein kinase c [Diplodia seriata]|uniref:protein kinase C n=1 Tax=Diplodia seriata TaxID=420778 RepID=A0A0G2DZK3_9PEZI|nr:putative protein kinase c [Diplodia seriata]
MNEDDAIRSVQGKIEREKALINAANAMRQSTNNPAVLSRLDGQIREGRRNIEYLEGRARELQMRRVGTDIENLSLGSGSNGPPSPEQRRNPLPPPPKDAPGEFGDDGNYGQAPPGGYSQLSGGQVLMPPKAPYAAPGPGQPRQRANYSKLDLIKYDTPHLGPRIQLMLSQLEFKLSVEKQYKDGIEKMVRLYQMEGDRKSKADAEARRIESNQKIQLLKQALKRYEDLHVDIEGGDGPDDDSLNVPSARKPLTGHLTLRVHQVADVDHAATGRFSRGPDTFVIMKVEDVFKGRTKATRNDRWTDEVHEFTIENANEVELTVYDRTGDHPLPIGMLWVRISDIAEEMRRKRIETELNSSSAMWVSADKMGAGGGAQPDMQFQPPPGQPQAASGPGGTGGGSGQGMEGAGPQPQTGPIYIDAWFALEPVGRIQLTLSFAKQNKNSQPFDIGLGRKGAIRQRKEEIHEQYGHKFVQQQFYNIMRCALCGDFLKYAAGMQCSDCKYTCHKKCYHKVVTKCITQSNAETDPDEAKLNHRIPHRFEPFANMGANWCCHCGYVLPFGKKQCRKCSECGSTCHANCVHFVPDFCGMSMEVANQILAEISGAKKRQTRIGLDHFNFLAVLGKGNFGKVMLAETKSNKQLYAIKVLKKEFIIENDEVESTRSEKRVFLIANKERHPFLLNLHACFQTETRVYFVMEYVSGGDLMLHIQRGQFGTKRAQFYAAEVCLALKYFHENGVIYRDLKLDNILLALDGHIKIADYGLCKEDMWYGSTTSTFCGTPEFMAPEILLDKKYGRAVDWWAFGVLIYQMLLQQSPFRGEDEDEIYDAILADEPLYPIHMPRDSVSILQKLLTREPELRLGSGPTDAQEIMSHAFFRNINWEDVYHKRIPAPFVPAITSATDTSNFDQEFTSVTPVLTPVQSVLSQAMQEEFRGFSYSADFV